MVILTGGAGFIGSCLLKELNNNGIDDILIVDNLGNSNKWQNLIGKKFINYLNKYQFRELFKNKPELLGKPEAIFHLGACTKTTELNADYLIDNNFNYSIELAQFALDKDIKFIYASSAATYGDGAFGYSDELYNELVPLNCYGFSKHIFDLWVLKNGYDKNFVGLKFFNVFGPNEYHKQNMASMVFKAYNQVNVHKYINLFESSSENYSNGGQMRDFVYVNDVIKVIFELYSKNLNGIFNLGTGIPRSWNDLAEAVFKTLNIASDIRYIPMPEELINQYQNYTCADMKKLKKVLPHFEFRSLENAVDDYINNYLAKNYLRF